jgi:hypothetical protein
VVLMFAVDLRGQSSSAFDITTTSSLYHSLLVLVGLWWLWLWLWMAVFFLSFFFVNGHVTNQIKLAG